MASFQDEFFEYFRKRLENEKRSSPKGIPEFEKEALEEARRLMEDDTDDVLDLTDDQVESLLRVYGKPPGIEDVRDWRTRPLQSEFDMERDLGKDMRDWRDRPNPPGRINPGEQMGFPGGQFTQAMKPDNKREQRRQQYIQDLVGRQRGGFEDRPSTFSSIGDILSELSKTVPALRGFRNVRGAIDPMINAVRGQRGVQKLLFPPNRRKK